MRDPSKMNGPLLQDVIPRSSRCAGFMILCATLGFVVLMSSMPHTQNEDEQHANGIQLLTPHIAKQFSSRTMQFPKPKMGKARTKPFTDSAGVMPSMQTARNRQFMPRLAAESDDAASAPPAAVTAPPAPEDKRFMKCPGYPNCGCDGEGRKMVGIGTIITWWPIKVYGPCNKYIEAGGVYRRKGQDLDETLFGRKQPPPPQR
eukprot:gnl/MRDRNA2_/MRDRNA2_33930_c0_seq1.p1 gnl/MRDRNA2_/MRDRNA2_33930_c0~~gnl/MRDRNA2_/MRDRNA2_33930_c0_seq1.p1  ORF type:complete len:203 (+),score=26.48 gnl/MRDRNA2_/MRDRNA2_33930_c0_seq1:81-689(+)